MSDETQIKQIEQLIKDSDAYNHKENVRVYRNVQAATDQLLQKQTQDLGERFSGMEKQIQELRGKLEEMDAKSAARETKKSGGIYILILVTAELSLLLQILNLVRG